MDNRPIPRGEARVYMALRDAKRYLTRREIALQAGITPSMAHRYLVQFEQNELLVVDTTVWPKRYRLSDQSQSCNVAYAKKLESACEIFGVAAS